MQLITVSGPPSAGKTAVIAKIVEGLQQDKMKVAVVKFDCLSTKDQEFYQKKGIVARTGLSGNICPDHFFVSNIEDCVAWANRKDFAMLISESAGLCNRCSPHIRGALAVCVIDNLSGVETPRKIGPMLKLADIVVITKGDIVSQGEREVFAFRVKQANPRAVIVHINGITGQGAQEAKELFCNAAEFDSLIGCQLRFSMPAATCSYCLGQVRIGKDFQMGNVKKMELD
ncbi:Urease accessory protein UreG [Sporomusa ovata DSM 2662]|uniref:Ni2+-binding GTPase involved in regulation of expression and maturation of hydrogenase n=1 Tax=Sporomusa ovata TaxID=2378 RepID=A0A0U1L1I8_9FIRM|nr:GTP-binding protein [Sporomusa ovata]EQB25006.1 Ni2+-binding GTPase involved in regulation of expression and maturation of urease and hydrogenase [Sporomusa ovata DSM 2662]CQR73550.1 Ni2+-binding GTPase involved in regulation of expression and maturation of hydrogenase [Sporomusa ovata]